MILLSLDDNRVITVALVPYVPNAAVIAMASEAKRVNPREDGDRIKLLPQLQILRKADLSVIESATMTPMELHALWHLVKAIGKSLVEVDKTIDEHFNAYREAVLKQANANIADEDKTK